MRDGAKCTKVQYTVDTTAANYYQDSDTISEERTIQPISGMLTGKEIIDVSRFARMTAIRDHEANCV